MADFNAVVQYQISQKYLQWEPSLYVWTGMMKLIGALGDYAYVPNTHHSRIESLYTYPSLLQHALLVYCSDMFLNILTFNSVWACFTGKKFLRLGC